MHSSHGLQSKLTALAFIMVAVTLWLLMRGYHGLTGDGQIYALQATARFHTQLAADLYLQNTSQDRFTIFSGPYAWFIQLLGLEQAARCLTMFFTLWFLAASWSAARAIGGRDAAWLAVAFLLIIDGSYGASGVFRISEQFLSARLPAEALIATALAVNLRGMKLASVAIAAAAMLIHPLIALPGLLYLMSLGLSGRASVIGAIIGLLTTAVIALGAANIAWMSRVLPVMDPAWLSVVQERSQFLFLKFWSFRDWDLNARPFLYLAFTMLAIPDLRVRKICLAAVLVGAAGLAAALIATPAGPVALLVQGQAWRWVWIPAFLSALLLPFTVLTIWKEDCGPPCALLLISGWTLSAVDGTACVSLALIAWLTRSWLSARLGVYLRWVPLALGLAIAAWILAQSWNIVDAALHAADRTLGAAQLREIFGLKISAALFAAMAWWWIRGTRSAWAPAALSIMLLVVSIFMLPAAFHQARALGAASDIAEFSEWRQAIPLTGTVLVAPPTDVGAFVWFTLERPNYLALDQSAGAVFSRATAMEIKRRSDVLLPVTDPDWEILTKLRAGAAAQHRVYTATRPLTAKSLMQICSDPQLGFVISQQDVGFEPLRHTHAGPWRDWNLYDCRRLRTARPAT
jgi:hypothetical protein